jgi:uncharacterized protein with PQ loop repeat
MKKELVHIEMRKRLHKGLDSYPHQNKWVRALDNFLIFVAIVGPLMNIPQIFKVFYFQEVSGISLISWSMYTFFDIPWIIYGIVHKEKPIVTAYILWFLTNLLVVIGTLLYR